MSGRKDAPARLGHMIGGEKCREYLGQEYGYCWAPAVDGLCDEHAEQRRAELEEREDDGRLSRL